MACGTPTTEVAAVDKAQAKREAERQVSEAEAFAADAQRAIDQAAAAAAEAERVVAEQKAKAAAEAAADAARRNAAARASRSRTTAARPAAPRVAPSGDVWGRLAACESGGNPRAVGGGGRYFGLYQFTLSTWRSVGGSGNPVDASPAEQTSRAQILQRRSGWGQWPYCSRKLGLR